MGNTAGDPRQSRFLHCVVYRNWAGESSDGQRRNLKPTPAPDPAVLDGFDGPDGFDWRTSTR